MARTAGNSFLVRFLICLAGALAAGMQVVQPQAADAIAELVDQVQVRLEPVDALLLVDEDRVVAPLEALLERLLNLGHDRHGPGCAGRRHHRVAGHFGVLHDAGEGLEGFAGVPGAQEGLAPDTQELPPSRVVFTRDPGEGRAGE